MENCFLNVCKKRESCRNFTGESVPKQALETIVECGCLAPSACNSQPWKFFVVEQSENLEKLKSAVQWVGNNKFTDKASAMIVILGDKVNYPERVGKAICGRNFSDIDIGICIENMALCATTLGYGSCILGGFYEGKIREIIGVSPKDKRKVKLVLALGVPEKEPKVKTRKDRSETVEFIK